MFLFYFQVAYLNIFQFWRHQKIVVYLLISFCNFYFNKKKSSGPQRNLSWILSEKRRIFIQIFWFFSHGLVTHSQKISRHLPEIYFSINTVKNNHTSLWMGRAWYHSSTLIHVSWIRLGDRQLSTNSDSWPGILFYQSKYIKLVLYY